MIDERYEKWDARDRANYEAYKKAQGRISTLEAALRKIAEHPHLEGIDDGNVHIPASESDFYSGVRSGHRCAAEIARKALEPK